MRDVPRTAKCCRLQALHCCLRARHRARAPAVVWRQDELHFSLSRNTWRQVCAPLGCNCQWHRQTRGREQNRQINPGMRGEPSRDLLDASQGRFASPLHLAGSSQRQLELGSQAAKNSAARQPCTRPAPRGHHAKRQEAAPRNENVGAPDGAHRHGPDQHRPERGLRNRPPQSAQPRLGGRDAPRAVAAGGRTFRKGRLRAHPTLADVSIKECIVRSGSQ